MIKDNISPLGRFVFVFIILIIFPLNAQNNKPDNVLSSFKEYTKIPRELVYTHVSKSTYILGETMGFSAYVLDKNSKQLSTITTNLYCTISDKNDKVIKSKLLKVEKGVASGNFAIDSLFTSGDYTFRSYTNWMRNFNEQNYYVQTIKVIDPSTQQEVTTNTISNTVDAQFLPEGGHLVSNTKNTVGVVIKDTKGFGVAQVEGRIVDKNNIEVSRFKTNAFGLGKFVMTPESKNSYTAIIDVNNNEQSFKIEASHDIGISLSLTDLGSKVVLT